PIDSCLHTHSLLVAYPLSLHDALPISTCTGWPPTLRTPSPSVLEPGHVTRSDASNTLDDATTSTPPRKHRFAVFTDVNNAACNRSEEHTSELQSRVDLVCRLLLEKKKV